MVNTGLFPRDATPVGSAALKSNCTVGPDRSVVAGNEDAGESAGSARLSKGRRHRISDSVLEKDIGDNRSLNLSTVRLTPNPDLSQRGDRTMLKAHTVAPPTTTPRPGETNTLSQQVKILTKWEKRGPFYFSLDRTRQTGWSGENPSAALVLRPDCAHGQAAPRPEK